LKRTVDLDVSALLLTDDGRVLADDFLVYYNNLVSPDLSTVHSGDHVLCSENFAEENIEVNFDYLNPQICEILFVVSSYSESLLIFDLNIEVCIFDVEHENIFFEEKIKLASLKNGALELGRILKCKEGWKFATAPTKQIGGLELVLDKYI
jgi:tellurium resistance protein TerD